MESTFSKFYHLKSNPFAETPDTRFYFDSPAHHRALDALERSILQGKGFAVLSGESGTGKTLLTRILLKKFENNAHTALVLFPKLSDRELLESLCEEFEISPKLPPSASTKMMLDRINRFLLQAAAFGQRAILLIDEAHALPNETLEMLRLLSNLETEKDKLLQIILVGQPELMSKLEQPELRQLRNRIHTFTLLEPFTVEQTSLYIRHRLEVSGCSNLVRFDSKALRLLHQISQGLPRRINHWVEKILLFAELNRVRLIEEPLIEKLLQGTIGHKPKKRWLSRIFASLSGGPSP